jgi:hypothetical protein
MPLGDAIRLLAERTHQELDAVLDFFEHSKIVWRSFEEFVEEGHQVTSTNLATGTTVTQDGLLGLSQRYASDYLASFTFQKFVSIFEQFVFDLLRLVLLHNPRQLAKKQLEFAAVLAAKDREEVVLSVINRELNELKYERLRDWFEYLNKAVRLDCPTPDDVETLAEIKASRDILEHAAGVANSIYVTKAGRRARCQPGERVEISDAYYRESWGLLKKVVSEVSAAAVGRLSRPTTPPA